MNELSVAASSGLQSAAPPVVLSDDDKKIAMIISKVLWGDSWPGSVEAFHKAMMPDATTMLLELRRLGLNIDLA